jgi:hypothetical protein
MKSKCLYILLTFILFSIFSCRQTPPVILAEKIAGGKIFVDGLPHDKAWQQSNWTPVKNLRFFRLHPPSPKNISGYYKVTWDQDNCYFMFKVIDDKKYVLVTQNEIEVNYDLKVREMDGIELFFDVDRRGTEITVPADFNYLRFTYHTDTLNTSKSLQTNNFRKMVRFAQRDFLKGYFMEMAVPWQLLHVKARPDLELGFEVGIYDNDGSTYLGAIARVQNILAWSDTTGISPSVTRANYGVLRLNDHTPRE